MKSTVVLKYRLLLVNLGEDEQNYGSSEYMYSRFIRNNIYGFEVYSWVIFYRVAYVSNVSAATNLRPDFLNLFIRYLSLQSEAS